VIARRSKIVRGEFDLREQAQASQVLLRRNRFERASSGARSQIQPDRASSLTQSQQVIAREFVQRDEVVRVSFNAVFEKSNRLLASIIVGRNGPGGGDGYWR
jgi:hypothetical protein